jgi:hypothetical protein
VLQELALRRQVALRRPDVAARLQREEVDLAVRPDAVGARRRDDEVVAVADLEAAVDRVDGRGAAVDVEQLVAGRVAVQRAGRGRGDEADGDVVVAEQPPPVGDRVGVPAELQVLRLERPRLERVVRGERAAVLLDGDSVDDRRRQAAVVEQRGVGGEALDAHQLLGVEPAVRLPERGVPLVRDLAYSPVVRHRHPLLTCPLCEQFCPHAVRY